MAMIYCPECKKAISDQAYACPGCGYPLKAPAPPAPVKQKIPGRGFGISGMVMGIIGVVYSPVVLISVLNVLLDEKTRHVYANTFTGITFEIAIFGILALIFGFLSRHKGHKCKKSMSAIVMGFITIGLCALTVVLGQIFA